MNWQGYWRKGLLLIRDNIHVLRETTEKPHKKFDMLALLQAEI
jgi:hypothetical protein